MVPIFRRQEDAFSGEQVVDAERLLRDIASRWRTGDTLEYRSRVVLNHTGEQRLDVKIHALFRRPHFARVVFLTNHEEWSRVIVSDGRRVFDRPQGNVLRPPRTTIYALKPRLLQDIPHPLDDTGYFTEQFLSPTPLVPPPEWGKGDDRPDLAAVRYTITDAKKGKQPRFRLTFTSGTSKDTVVLDALTLAPLQFTRVAEHTGLVQELLREQFDSVHLAPNLPVSLFQWSAADETGKSLRI